MSRLSAAVTTVKFISRELPGSTREAVQLHARAPILRGRRRSQDHGEDQQGEGQGRGPHDARRSGSLFIYVSRSVSKNRVKSNQPFVRALPAIKVPKENAESLLRKLLSQRLVDRTMKTVKQGDAALIPVRAAPAFDLSSFRAEIQARPSLRSEEHTSELQSRFELV